MSLQTRSHSKYQSGKLFLEYFLLNIYFDKNGIMLPFDCFRPDFDASREKLRKLGDAEGNLTKEEFNKMKQELEAEYLATFKKTVAMHETFLTRLANHPVFRNDMNLAIFLEYDKELNVRGKKKKEKLIKIDQKMHQSFIFLWICNVADN